jgi:hypothetical protein
MPAKKTEDENRVIFKSEAFFEPQALVNGGEK